MRVREILETDGKPSRLLFGLALCATFAFSLAPRIEQLRLWDADPTTYFAESVPISSTDSYYWFRMAREYRNSDGELAGRDKLRRFPDGVSFERIPAIARVIGRLAGFFDGDVYRAGILLTIALSSLFVFPLGFYCLRLGIPAAGVVAGLLTSFSYAYFHRSSIAFTDTDGGNLAFVWSISASIAWIAPDAGLRRNLVLAALSGLSLAAFCWWYDQRAFWLVYLAAFVLHLISSRVGLKHGLALLGTFVVLSNPLNIGSSIGNLSELARVYIFTSETVSPPGDEGAGETLAFPSVMEEIRELQRLPLGRTLDAIVRGPVLGALGLAAFTLLAVLRWRLAIPMLPIIALGVLALFRSYRYTMYLAPLVGIGLGAVVVLAIRGGALRLARVMPARTQASSRTLGFPAELLAYVVAFALVGFNLDRSSYHSTSRPAIHRDFLAGLLELKAKLPAGAAIWSSWTYGYAIADVARAATFDDPMSPDPVVAQLWSRSMTSSDPRELAEIVSFIANRGRRGLERAVAAAHTYPELLSSISAAYEPVRGDIYLLFTERMLKREYTEYHYKGQWDFEKRVGTRVGYDVRRCQQTAADVMVCSRTGEPDAVLDLVHGLVSGRFPLQKAVTIENGEVTSSIDYSHESNLIIQLLAGSETGSYTAHFINPVVYRSNFNQMYVLGRFDAKLFTEVVERYPGARAFRLTASALTPE